MMSKSGMGEDRQSLVSEIEALIRSEGFVPLGIVTLTPMPEDMLRFKAWLGENRHAGMKFLTQNLHLREDPRRLLDKARTAILFGLPYAQGDRLPRLDDPPRIAQYARLQDYHRVIWRKGESILSQIHARYGSQDEVGRVITDSAPVLERALTRRGGRGFIGKNTCFITPQFGSLMLLGEILTSLDLASTEPEKQVIQSERRKDGGCGTCRRCQVHCPTGALDQDYRIDARKCLAYWTIEHRGTIPEEYWPWLKQYLFGCDICQIVCPYNRGRKIEAHESLVKLKDTPPLFDMATMNQESYERLFGGTPMTRAKRPGLMRNALIAMTVTKDPQLDEALRILSMAPQDDVINATLTQIRNWLNRQKLSQSP